MLVVLMRKHSIPQEHRRGALRGCLLGDGGRSGAGRGRAGRDVLGLGHVAGQVRDAGGVEHGGARGARGARSHAMQLKRMVLWGALRVTVRL